VEVVPPHMNFAPMKNAIEVLKTNSERYSKIRASWESKGSPALAPQALVQINADLLQISRLFLNERGLPERPWFKNQIYAPGAYTGYDARPIAAVREYMDEKKWEKADAEIPQVSEAIGRAAKGIKKAADDLESAVVQAR
jgi:N-acetylated-alpha-linked acidic dipeptidase